MNKRIKVMEDLNVLVTGNGFDIHHKMKTRYADFLSFTRLYYGTGQGERYFQNDFLKKISSTTTVEEFDELSDSNFLLYFWQYSERIDSWVDFEQLIKNVTDFFRWFISECKKTNRYKIEQEKMGENSKIIAHCFKRILKFGISCYELKPTYKSEMLGIDEKKIIEALREEFDKLCLLFTIYLQVMEPVYRRMIEKSWLKEQQLLYWQIINIGAEHVITFNYTNTYERYGIKKENISYIHGSLEKNNIVLGFSDDNESDLEYVYFKKYFQCIVNKTELLQKTIDVCEAKRFNKERNIHIHFFGHSLDETDKEELVKIFDWGTFVTVYYLNRDDYCEKVIKIIKLLGKHMAVQRINNKTIRFIPILFDKYNEGEIIVDLGTKDYLE